MSRDPELPDPDLPSFSDLLAGAQSDEERALLWQEHIAAGGETEDDAGALGEFLHSGNLEGLREHMSRHAEERAAAVVNALEAEAIKAKFVSDLVEQKDDPHDILAILKEGFDHNFASELGIESSTGSDARPHIARGQYMAIESLRELAIFLCKFGVLKPGHIGMWLQEPNQALGNKTPTEQLFSSYDQIHAGIKSDVMRGVILSAEPFLKPDPEIHAELTRITTELT